MIRTIESCTTSSSFRVVDDVVNGGGNNTDSESGSEHSSVSVAVTTASDKDNGSFMLYIYILYIYDIWTSVLVLSPFKNRVFTKRLSHHHYSKRKKDHSLLL